MNPMPDADAHEHDQPASRVTLKHTGAEYIAFIDKAARQQAKRALGLARADKWSPAAGEPDKGADGPGARSRPHRTVTIEGKSGGSGHAPTIRIDVLRYSEDLHDRLLACGQISDRQHAAASRLLALWTSAGLTPRVSARVDMVGDPGDHVPPFDHDDTHHERTEETPRDRYRRLMRAFPGQPGALLDTMMCGQHPGTWRLASLQAALDKLADILKIPKE